MPLINSKIYLELNWNNNCAMYDADTYPDGDNANNRETTFKITSTKLYVPIVALSTKDNVNLTKQSNEGLKRSICWNEYKSKIEKKEADPDNLKRFPLYASFYDQLINGQFKKYDEKIAKGKGDDYTTGCLLDYQYFKDHYESIAVDLSKQKQLDADPRAFQQTGFYGMLNNNRILQRNSKSVEYNRVNAKLSNYQLNKLKPAVKNRQGTILRMNTRMFSTNNLPHELLLTTRQTTKLRNAIENNMSTDIKLSKAQISKIIQSGGVLGKLLGLLLKNGLPLIKNVIKTLAKSVLIPLGLTAAASAAGAGIQKKIYSSGTTTLVISNEEMNDIMKIVQALEDSKILLKGVSKTIKNEAKGQKGGFLSMLLDTLGAFLFGNLLQEKEF